ncbi:MAG: hypothetical protein GC152_05710 [Alphaproteobacteria bacterium]|nr:hypothetical protein [Alphaproteobacteria bacterium]
MILVPRAPSRHRFRVRKTTVAAVFGLMALGKSHDAVAQFIVSPLRVVLDEDAPAMSFVVSNPSDRILDIKAEWLDLAATPDGYAPAGASLRRRLSAAPYLNVEPARLRLEPGERGEVRVGVRGANLSIDGERRSHLMFAAAASRSPLRRTGGGLMADIGLAVSTPVLLRGKGDTRDIAVAFDSARLDRDDIGDLVLVARLSASGPFSPFGALVAEFETTARRPAEKLAQVGNVSVPIDANSQDVTLSLGRASLPEGILRVRYIGEAEYEGRVFAEKSYDIASPAVDD